MDYILFIEKTATLIINNYVRVSWIATTYQEAKTSLQREENINVRECAFRKSWGEMGPWLKNIEE